MNQEPKDVKSIFAEALEKKTPQDRAAYLDKACGGDADLRSKLESLLESHDQAGSFLEAPALDVTVTFDKSPLTEGPGTVIGPYKLLEKIGEGGMAYVYMAEQERPLRRRVALKIIKLGMDTKQVIARFEVERQALAVMDHPNIAKVFDAGATETGRPYFVMELVKGVSITEYCDKNKLSTPERLDLFIQVCNAVQHAHQKGIIHRDIKPSNVMVTLHDGKPVPKVIDFGIAKATIQRLTEKTLFTKYAQMIGTPEYMSPEQAEMSGLDIDTRADIYSLGVLLYELLTGTTPFDAEDLRSKGYGEMQRIIRETEPLKPSTKLSTMGDSLAGVAEHRKTNPDLLAKLVRGDLDWIVMKSLEKDRTRRYETVSSLAADVKRHLNEEPVEAGPPGATYRIGKFIRKHRRTVAAVATIVGIIIIGLVVSTSMYVLANRARQNEAVARTKAEQAKVIAEQAKKAEQEQRNLAETKAEDLRRSLYVNSIQLADAKYREGNIRRVRELLESCPNDLRGWEWDRLNYIRDESIMTLSGTSDQSIRPAWGKDDCIHAAMLDPDGKRIVSGHLDGIIRVWDSVTGKKLREFRAHGRELWSLAVSSNGQRVVSGGSDQTIKVWDTETFEMIRTIPGQETWFYLAVSPDGTHIASSAGGDGVLQIWDTQTGSELITLGDRKTNTDCFKFSPDGKRIISGDDAGDLKIWDVTTGEMLTVIHADPYSVGCIAVNSNGSQIASAGLTDKEIKVWDVQTRVQLASFRGHQPNFVGSLAFSPDGNYIVSGDNINLVKTWETATGRELATYRGHEGGINSLAFTRDGKRIVSGSWDGTVKLWDVSEEREPIRLPVCQGPPNSIRTAYTVAFSPDGKRMASNMEGMVKVWDVDSCVELMTLHRPVAVRQQELRNPQRTSIAFSTDGKLIGASMRGGTIKVWDMEKMAEVVTLKAGQRVWDLAFSPDSKRLVAASMILGDSYQPKGVVNIWDLSKGEEIMGLPLGDLVPLSVAFSADGKYVVLGFGDGAIKVWDVSSGAEAMGMMGRHGAVLGVAFSPDGKLLASASHHGIPNIWDAATGLELTTLGGHNDAVVSIAFSPDGRRVLTASVDRTAKVWDVATGAELLSLPFDSAVHCATFNANGTVVAAATADGAVFLWDSNIPAHRFELRNSGKAATKRVDELHQQLGLYHDVIAHLQVDLTLDSTVRGLALKIANSREWEDAEKLRKETWESVSSSGKSTDEYQTALEKADKANSWEPNDPGILNTLAAAQYRVGMYEDALNTLTKSERILSAAGEESNPLNVAFVAMSLHQLGRADEAKAVLEQLRSLCKEERFAEDQEAQGFLAEAEKLVAGENK